MAHFNNVYVRFSPGPIRLRRWYNCELDLERNDHKRC